MKAKTLKCESRLWVTDSQLIFGSMFDEPIAGMCHNIVRRPSNRTVTEEIGPGRLRGLGTADHCRSGCRRRVGYCGGWTLAAASCADVAVVPADGLVAEAAAGVSSVCLYLGALT